MTRGLVVLMMLLLGSGVARPQAQLPWPYSSTSECTTDNADIHRLTKQESFVWNRVTQGKEANFNEESEYGDTLSHPCRILRWAFLDALLLKELQLSLTRRGVRITGAHIREKIDLENAALLHELWINRSLIDEGADLSGLQSNNTISLDGSTVHGTLNLNGLHVGSDLMISDATIPDEDIDLGSAVIRGHLYLNNSTVSKTLDMEGIQIEGNLDMAEGHFGEVDLKNARIGGDLLMNKANFKSLNLSSAQIKENLDSSQAAIHDRLDMSLARITGAFLLRSMDVFPKMAVLSDLSFSSADWGMDPVTILTKLTAAQGGYNPTLYTKLAKSYSDAGQTGVARNLLIERQNSEYRHANAITKCYLFAFWLVAAYGYRPELGFLWIFVFVVIGWAIFRRGAKRGMAVNPPDSWFVFALDSVIPGIQLRKDHEAVSFRDWRKYVLYFLRFLGAVVVILVLELLKRSVVDSG